MKKRLSLVIICLFVSSSYAWADNCTRLLLKLEGWTIISVTSVDGDFEGCDYDNVIRFSDGSAYRCSECSYSYSYNPDAIIFGKKESDEGRSFLQIKALINDDLYEMNSILLE